jgi:hypothetical protein
MAYEITRVTVWAGEIEDHPGALADKLEILQRAGANLEFVIVRPTAPLSNVGVLFVAPLVGAAQTAAAAAAGLRPAESIHSLRITGRDRPGLLAEISRAIGNAGLNISGASAASLEGRGVIYLRFECDADAGRAVQLITALLA